MSYSITNGNRNRIKPSKVIWTFVAMMVLVFTYVLIAHPDYIVGGLPPKQHNDLMLVNDKYDGDCTGHEIAGRCADKCPAPEFVRGFDKETGAAVCGYVTGCPYGDSVPLGPECDRLAPAEQAQPIDPPTVMEFQGK